MSENDIERINENIRMVLASKEFYIAPLIVSGGKIALI